MTDFMIAYIGLGSNLGDPEQHVSTAFDDLDAISDTQLLAKSDLYLTESFPPGNPDYINAVAKIKTCLSALCLLSQLFDIESRHGRVREQKWGSRTLDLDLLLYGDELINLPTLTIPHPHMAERPTVLYPLADIEPSLVLPNGTTLQDLLVQVPPVGIISKYKESACQT